MIQRNQFKRSALALAIAVATSGTVLAQSNTIGYIFGQVSGGGTVSVENLGTGLKREISVDADGNFRASSLPTGRYKVTYNGQSKEVVVNVGTGSAVSFADASTLGVVEVTGSAINPIDISSVESTTILTSEQIAKIPVARNVTQVALLAPGTVRGDAAFGNLASFGGSSVSENAYFVNGFNITNAFKNLAFAQLPFEAIAEQQVKTGGYGAEFGRSTGGVINIITKRGSNEFQAGGNVFWTPEALRETNPDLYYNNGQLVSDNSKDNGTSTTAAVWASGALIQDRLFAYGLVQYAKSESDSFPGTVTGFSGGSNVSFNEKSPLWLLKLDWNISDNHLLEMTAFSDERNSEDDYYTTAFGTQADPSTEPNRNAYQGTFFNDQGGNNYSLKYTGYLTDNFTLSALYGHGEYSRTNYAVTAGGIVERYAGNVQGDVAGCPRIIDSRPLAVRQASGDLIGCNFIGALFGRPDAEDTRDQFRIDGEWVLGDHLIRFGYDADEFTSVDGEADEGGVRYQFAQGTVANPYGGFVRRTIFRTGAEVGVDQEAFYVQDSWQATDNFLLYAGLRWDSFDNKNGLGETFAKIDNQFAPRLGFSWDVKGDSSFKLFGNAGRYALPLTATVAVRGASASRYEIQDFRYTGIDPITKAPIGLTVDSSLPYGSQFFANNEFGVAKDPRGITSENLEPMYQDEYIIGFQSQITDEMSGGIRAIHRDLKRAIDDTCNYAPFAEYAEENGLEFNPYNPGFAFCHLYNPGSDGIFNVDVDGDGTFEQITVAADVLGPAAIRKYNAIELFMDGNWDKFFLQGSWTIAHSYGNTEGGVKSDIGQDDTGTTQDFDYPELTIGSYGDLPNDRRHSLKLFGSYSINDEWSVGGNVIVQSGRPQNCIGIYANDPAHYRNSYFSCDSVEPSADTTTTPGSLNNGSTVVPRGTVGRNPWTRSLDLSVAYAPAALDGKLSVKADIFNIFNERKATAVNEVGEDSNGSPANAAPTYLTPTSWQAPRSVRFSVQYDF